MSTILKELSTAQKLPRWFVSLVALAAVALLLWTFNSLWLPFARDALAKLEAIDKRTMLIDEKCNGLKDRVQRVETQVDELQKRK